MNKWNKPQDVDGITMAFPGDVIGTLMPEFKDVPSEFRDDHKWSRFVETLFFKGGKLPKTLPGIDQRMARNHLGACLGSFEPKHEHKIAACAWLASMWFEEPK